MASDRLIIVSDYVFGYFASFLLVYNISLGKGKMIR